MIVGLLGMGGDRRRMWWVGGREGGVVLWGFRLGHCGRGCGGRGLAVGDDGGMCGRHCGSEGRGIALWLGGGGRVFGSGVVDWVQMVLVIRGV